MRHLFLRSGIILGFTLLTSCKVIDNREQIVHDYLLQKINSESNGVIKLDSFKKTNGIEKEIMGMKIYTLEWQAAISSQQEIWKGGDAIRGYWGKFNVITVKPVGWGAMMLGNPIHLLPGAKIHLSGEAHLQKTEQGWRVKDFKIIKSQTLNADDSTLKLSVSANTNNSSADQLQNDASESLIKAAYPVIIPVKVPKHAMAEKGSAEFSRLETINEKLIQSGWFTIQRREEGIKVHFEYLPSSSAPQTIQATQGGFEAPAAEAVFVKVLNSEVSGNKVTLLYQVRLERPTPLFSLFQFIHPQAEITQTKERHAHVEHRGKDWVLLNTDEEFKRSK